MPELNEVKFEAQCISIGAAVTLNKLDRYANESTIVLFKSEIFKISRNILRILRKWIDTEIETHKTKVASAIGQSLTFYYIHLLYFII